MERDPGKQFPQAIAYQNIRDTLDTGDMVVFGGYYLLSRMIKRVTGFPASHIASMVRTDDGRICFVEASEGDMYPEREGVIVNYFSNSLSFYKGDVWVARLSNEVRQRIDAVKLRAFLFDQVGKGYDYDDMKKAGMDLLKLKKLYGDKISFMGALDARVLIANDKDAIMEELKKKVPGAMEGGGYALHSDHSISYQVEYDTYCFFKEEGLKIGTYK